MSKTCFSLLLVGIDFEPLLPKPGMVFAPLLPIPSEPAKDEYESVAAASISAPFIDIDMLAGCVSPDQSHSIALPAAVEATRPEKM
jgi:hypothetical protein